MLRLDIKSVEDLCGDRSQKGEVVVFGFEIFKYRQVAAAIKRLGFKAIDYSDYQFKHDVKTRAGLHTGFKDIIRDLVLENYKREQRGEPIIPLIIVVGFGDQKLDKSKISKREIDEEKKGVILAEMRIIFKLAHEFGEEFNKIANNTFKFAEVIPTEKGHTLQPVKPFWLEEDWKKQWEERKKTTQKEPYSEYKHNLWREKYRNLIEQEMKSTPKETAKKSETDLSKSTKK